MLESPVFLCTDAAYPQAKRTDTTDDGRAYVGNFILAVVFKMLWLLVHLYIEAFSNDYSKNVIVAL